MVHTIGLVSLPAEILQQIACSLDGDSALSLILTCQRLRSNCDDVVVWKSIIVSFWHPNPPPDDRNDSRAGGLPGLLNEIQQNQHAPSLAKRYAVAVSRASEMQPELVYDSCKDSEYPAKIKQYVRFVPHLRIFSYAPLCSTTTVTNLLSLLVITQKRSRHRLNMPLPDSVVSSAEPSTRNEGQRRHDSPFDLGMSVGEEDGLVAFSVVIEMLNQDCKTLINESRRSQASVLYEAMDYRDEGPGARWSRNKAFWVIASLAQDLNRRSSESHPFYRPSVLCPSFGDFDISNSHHEVSKMPLFTFTPTPFVDPPANAISPWQTFLGDFSRDIVPRDHDSVWEGYYWRIHPAGLNDRLDGPMQNIVMHSTRSHLNNIHGQGHDDHGPFTIEGNLQGGVGIWAMKSYLNGTRWLWTGKSTPFGFVGRWDYPEQLRATLPRGFFWIWKKKENGRDSSV